MRAAPAKHNEPQRRSAKSACAFRTISEVSTDLEVPAHVLRFWETKFPQIRPLKRGGGRRYYRPEDVELLRDIHRLLYRDGYTIKGVQRRLREAAIISAEPVAAPIFKIPELFSIAQREFMAELRDELIELRNLLKI